jgi:Predicted pyridoxal phosphate-dependent enzyme apparently involved in regulation of cell wall biogenesis
MISLRKDSSPKGAPTAERLSEKLAELIPLRHYLVTGYARNGFFLLMKALQWDSVAEIIIPAFTCPIIKHTITAAGYVPVPVDAEEHGINIDPQKITASITDRTKAIYVVHTYGMVADIETICAIAKKHNLIVIEDLAHAPFSLYKGKPLGTYGDYAILSFTKKIINFEGGAVGTNNTTIYSRMAMLQREYMRQRSYSPRRLVDYFVRMIGSWWESRFSPVALLLMKLNDAINTLVYKGSYGISIDDAGFLSHEISCRITLRQTDHLLKKYRENNADYLKNAGAAKGIRMYQARQNGHDTRPFYFTGIPTNRSKLYKLLSFRTWHNSNEPGAYPRADYLYGNYRIFSKAVLLFLPQTKRKDQIVLLQGQGGSYDQDVK